MYVGLWFCSILKVGIFFFSVKVMLGGSINIFVIFGIE